MLDPGFEIRATQSPLGFEYGPDTFGPPVEYRHLNDIRASLLDSKAKGPDVVYAIVMDVGRKSDYRDLSQRHLLFGVVTYASGKLGKEPIRSQGHIHAISASTNYSTAEVYEIWKGHCIVLMQETADDDPGRVFAVSGKVGDVIVVPPGWAHMTINADSSNSMTFGAWCIRDYGFEYGAVRQHHGLAYYPLVADSGGIEWKPNPHYNETSLIVKKARQYDDLGITADVSIYEQYRENKDAFDFVTRPTSYLKIWKGFEP